MNHSIETLIAAAEKHVDVDPDHEIGDLQDFLRAAWSLFSPLDVQRFSDLPEVVDCYCAATLEEDLPLQPLTAEDLVSAAERHGEDSEPDHEAGDLQDFLRAAWRVLDEPRRRQLFDLESVRNTYFGATGDLLAAAGAPRRKLRMR